MARGRSLVIDTSECEKGLKHVAKRISDSIERELNSTGSEVRKSMRGRINTKSGETVGSINIRSGRDRKGPYVETSVHGAAAALEFGAKGPGARVMRPRPFLRPSLNRAIRTFRPKV